MSSNSLHQRSAGGARERTLATASARSTVGSMPFLGVAFAVALALAGAGAMVSQEDWQPPASWLQPMEPFEIADGLWYVGSRELAAYLLVSDAGHLLIDAPMEENAELLLSNIRAAGFDPGDIEILLATHGHFDHTGAMAALVEATGGRLLLSQEAAELVGRGGRGDFLLGDDSSYPPVRAAGTLEDRQQVELGPWKLRAEFTPGHTKGCTSWTFEAKIDGTRHPVVLACSLSVLPGYRLTGPDPTYPGHGVDFCRSLERMESLEAQLFLANHGQFMDLETKRSALAERPAAFVDPDGYRHWLETARERIERTLQNEGANEGCGDLLR